MVGAVVAVGAVLVLLGADFAAAAWLGVGAALMWLAQGAVESPSPPAGRTLRAGLGLVAGVFGGLLLLVVVRVDWRPLIPSDVHAMTAEVAGRLLTADLVLLLGAGLLLAAVLAAAAWNLRQADDRGQTVSRHPACDRSGDPKDAP
jgi:hypothetical protein